MTHRFGRATRVFNAMGPAGVAGMELAPSARAEAESHPAVTYQSGYGSMMASGASPNAPMRVGAMEYTMPPNRMLEPHRQGEQSRMLWHQTGRRFGNPPPGWIGAGGVAQIPHPNMGMRPAPDRSFGPGLSAGQGGVQSFQGGAGPMAVQTYGSLGYASMGDGSMDMAVRQGRRFSKVSDYENKVTCNWWCSKHPDSQYCKPGGLCTDSYFLPSPTKRRIRSKSPARKRRKKR